MFRSAVEDAVRCSHRHPEAIDFACVQATTVKYALSCPNPAAFDPQELLAKLQSPSVCSTDAVRTVLRKLATALTRDPDHKGDIKNDYDTVKSIVSAFPRPGSGMDFQIASIHMMPCVLYIVGAHHSSPLHAVQSAISLGGDTDTAASMVGAVLGALHGPEWARKLSADLENGPRGRDYGLALAEGLWALDLGSST
jgi:poly(ADP-ribose) glycohydrolase ARH3